MRYHILYQFNEKYVPYAGVSITSVLENNNDSDITIWILGEELTEHSIKKIQVAVEAYEQKVVFIDTSMLIARMKELDMPTYRGSYAANMRLFLPEVIPCEIEKILYLDADTIVDGSLAELFRTDFMNNSIAMVMDSIGELHKEEIGLDKAEGYYNSGVILFDMNRWRENKLTDKIVDHVKNVRNNYPSPDQDLLNVVCRNHILPLSPRYNFQPIHVAFESKTYFKCYAKTFYYSPDEVEESKKKPIIYHFFRFIGEFPWNADNVHPDSELFDRYCSMSLWRDYTKQKAELSFAIKIEKIMYKILPKGMFLRIFKICHRMFYKKANKLAMKNQISTAM